MCFYSRHRQPSKYRRIVVQQTVRASVLPIRTPPKCCPSPWPDTPLEILRGHLPVPIQTWSWVWVLLLWALQRTSAVRGSNASFLQRIPQVLTTAKLSKPLRCVAGSTAPTSSLMAGRASWLGISLLCALLGLGSLLRMSALAVSRGSVCDAWLVCARYAYSQSSLYIILYLVNDVLSRQQSLHVRAYVRAWPAIGRSSILTSPLVDSLF
ncbi:hypothetical protein J3F84DRAFT_109925 [Trichoderma pleuroticola]